MWVAGAVRGPGAKHFSRRRHPAGAQPLSAAAAILSWRLRGNGETPSPDRCCCCCSGCRSPGPSPSSSFPGTWGGDSSTGERGGDKPAGHPGLRAARDARPAARRAHFRSPGVETKTRAAREAATPGPAAQTPQGAALPAIVTPAAAAGRPDLGPLLRACRPRPPPPQRHRPLGRAARRARRPRSARARAPPRSPSPGSARSRALDARSPPGGPRRSNPVTPSLQQEQLPSALLCTSQSDSGPSRPKIHV